VRQKSKRDGQSNSEKKQKQMIRDECRPSKKTKPMQKTETKIKKKGAKEEQQKQ